MPRYGSGHEQHEAQPIDGVLDLDGIRLSVSLALSCKLSGALGIALADGRLDLRVRETLSPQARLDRVHAVLQQLFGILGLSYLRDQETTR